MTKYCIGVAIVLHPSTSVSASASALFFIRLHRPSPIILHRPSSIDIGIGVILDLSSFVHWHRYRPSPIVLCRPLSIAVVLHPSASSFTHHPPSSIGISIGIGIVLQPSSSIVFYPSPSSFTRLSSSIVFHPSASASSFVYRHRYCIGIVLHPLSSIHRHLPSPVRYPPSSFIHRHWRRPSSFGIGIGIGIVLLPSSMCVGFKFLT